MNPEELEGLLQQLLQAIDQVLASGEVLDDDFMGILAQTIQTLMQAIETVSQSQQTPEAPTTPPELQQAMPSSNVEGFAYDDKNQRLLVRFLGKYPNRQGPVYSYGGVPPQIFNLFRTGAVPARTDGQNRWGRWWRGKVPSIGASLYTLLKTQGYPYQRIG